MCIRSKQWGEVVILLGKGSLDCLAIGQIGQKKGYFGENVTGMEVNFFIFTKGTWPNL